MIQLGKPDSIKHRISRTFGANAPRLILFWDSPLAHNWNAREFLGAKFRRRSMLAFPVVFGCGCGTTPLATRHTLIYQWVRTRWGCQFHL